MTENRNSQNTATEHVPDVTEDVPEPSSGVEELLERERRLKREGKERRERRRQRNKEKRRKFRLDRLRVRVGIPILEFDEERTEEPTWARDVVEPEVVAEAEDEKDNEEARESKRPRSEDETEEDEAGLKRVRVDHEGVRSDEEMTIIPSYIDRLTKNRGAILRLETVDIAPANLSRGKPVKNAVYLVPCHECSHAVNRACIVQADNSRTCVTCNARKVKCSGNQRIPTECDLGIEDEASRAREEKEKQRLEKKGKGGGARGKGGSRGKGKAKSKGKGREVRTEADEETEETEEPPRAQGRELVDDEAEESEAEVTTMDSGMSLVDQVARLQAQVNTLQRQMEGAKLFAEDADHCFGQVYEDVIGIRERLTRLEGGLREEDRGEGPSGHVHEDEEEEGENEAKVGTKAKMQE